jgi:hypothetical protein
MVPGAGTGPEVGPETPVREVMGLLRTGAAEVTVADDTGPLGVIRSGTVLDRLIDPRGTSA